MKELSIEEKAKAYDKAVNKFAYLLESTDLIKGDLKHDIEIIFPELKESEDERIRKEILDCFKAMKQQGCFPSKHKEQYDSWIAWLEKQGEHANFRNKIQVGDKVTRNEDGVLVNLSQLKRIAKPAENKGKHGMGISEATKQKLEDNLNKALEKETSESWDKFLDEQGKQKSADKVEPKFRKGDWVVDKNGIVKKILSYNNGVYKHTDGYSAQIFEDEWRLWDITKDAKDGDVLADDYGIYIFEKFDECDRNCYVCIGAYQYSQKVYECEHMLCSTDAHPATKEQCDTLMKAMADAGYTFDFERKELKKIEQKSAAWSDEDEMLVSLAKEELLKDLEVKEVDLELITGWFDHIAQIADDRMTLTNQRMTDAHALDEIKCLAKNSSEFITKHYKAQKGEKV